MNQVVAQLATYGVVPVVVLEDAADAPALGKALVAGGLPCAEITLRTDAAVAGIQTMAEACPEMLIGAGTVLTVAQAEAAVQAGAAFVVTPGFDPAVVDWCLANEIPVIPGVMTPTEINMALNKGVSVVKFFPAEAAGGVKALKAISGPYKDVRFMPTGGIGLHNLRDYLECPPVIACGGSWVVNKQLVASQDFVAMTELVKEAVALVKEVRG